LADGRSPVKGGLTPIWAERGSGRRLGVAAVARSARVPSLIWLPAGPRCRAAPVDVAGLSAGMPVEEL